MVKLKYSDIVWAYSDLPCLAWCYLSLFVQQVFPVL